MMKTRDTDLGKDKSQERELSAATRRFWNFSEQNETRTLRIDGIIAEESWLEDGVTPKIFKNELDSSDGDIELWLNSAGGDVFAAAQIYNMLKDYKGKITVKIDGLAASAASVIAMAGTEILMSPVSQMMVHNPATIAIGDSEEMSKAIDMLGEIKESIINAYEIKTNLPRSKISRMMDSESWMNAHKAVELGFADGILYSENHPETENFEAVIFSRAAVTNNVLIKLRKAKQENQKTHLESLYKRLNLLKGR